MEDPKDRQNTLYFNPDGHRRTGMMMATAYFLINTRLHHELEVADKAKDILKSASLPSFEVKEVFGIYDIIVKLSAADDDSLRKIVLEKLRKIENIESAITMMVNEEQE